MSKIKVGEYVRTKIGIGRIVEIFEYEDGHKDYYTDKCIDDEDKSTTLHKHQILKHSHNIIDLIKSDDILVYELKGLKNSTHIDIVKEHKDARTSKIKLSVGLYSLEQVFIKKVLTKEQFCANCYEAEE